MDYIAEANRFMYDDNYITEEKVSVDGKKYDSKKAAEEDLKKKGLKGKQVADKMSKAHKQVLDLSSSYHKDNEQLHQNFDPDDVDNDLHGFGYDRKAHKELHDKISKEPHKATDADFKKINSHINKAQTAHRKFEREYGYWLWHLNIEKESLTRFLSFINIEKLKEVNDEWKIRQSNFMKLNNKLSVKVSIDDKIYNSITEASNQLNIGRKIVYKRLKSNDFNTWFILKDDLCLKNQ